MVRWFHHVSDDRMDQLQQNSDEDTNRLILTWKCEEGSWRVGGGGFPGRYMAYHQLFSHLGEVDAFQMGTTVPM